MKRLALVIGIDDYAGDNVLKSAIADAKAMEQTLKVGRNMNILIFRTYHK